MSGAARPGEASGEYSSHPNDYRGHHSPLFDKWFWTFVISLLVAVVLAALFPEQNPAQQFYFRILIGLAAAGIGAIIPGFLELEAKLWRVTLRAVGAVGLFLVVFLVNPPPFLLTTHAYSAPPIAGTWQYQCSSQGAPYGHGGIEHGGLAEFSVTQMPWGYQVSAIGRRTWIRNKNSVERIAVDPPEGWATDAGTLLDSINVHYEYHTTDKGASYFGQTDLRLIYDHGVVIQMEGTFQRRPPSQDVYGRIVYTRPSTVTPIQPNHEVMK